MKVLVNDGYFRKGAPKLGEGRSVKVRRDEVSGVAERGMMRSGRDRNGRARSAARSDAVKRGAAGPGAVQSGSARSEDGTGVAKPGEDVYGKAR